MEISQSPLVLFSHRVRWKPEKMNYRFQYYQLSLHTKLLVRAIGQGFFQCAPVIFGSVIDTCYISSCWEVTGETLLCRLSSHRPSHCKLTNIHRMNAKGIWVILNKEAEPLFILLFFNKFFSVRLFCVVILFFILATTANDLRLRRIFCPRFYPLHLFSCLNSWERTLMHSPLEIYKTTCIKMNSSHFHKQDQYYQLLLIFIRQFLFSSSAGGPRFNPQSRTASYQRRYKNGTSSSLV